MTANGTLTVKEAAARAGVSPRTIHRWVKRGLLKPRRKTPSGRPRFALDDVLRRVS